MLRSAPLRAIIDPEAATSGEGKSVNMNQNQIALVLLIADGLQPSDFIDGFVQVLGISGEGLITFGEELSQIARSAGSRPAPFSDDVVQAVYTAWRGRD